MRLLLLVVASHGCAPVDGGAPPPGNRPTPSWQEPDHLPTGVHADVYLLDDDVGALVRYVPSSGTMTSTPLGATPGRFARAEGKVWVTLPAERSIAVFDVRAGDFTRTATLETGPEPLGIAVNADASRLYVALATAEEVVELDADGTALRAWSVPGLPSWLALRPDGDGLYVGSATGGTLTWIDLGSGESSAVELPPTFIEHGAVAFPLANRITGDLSVSADGRLLAVPMLMTDNQTPLDPPTTNEEEVDNGYASQNSANINRFNPTIAMIPLGVDGAPDGRSAALALVSSQDEEGNLARSYLTSVAITPDGTMALGTMEAARRL
ncbi:MAG: YncE family protein, partial [Myxococcota bacterium]